MPNISAFYGITIFMHLTRKEHLPPHIHAIYGEYDASFLLQNGEVFEGPFPPKCAKLVKAFVLRYKKELQEMWDTEIYRKLPPLE